MLRFQTALAYNARLAADAAFHALSAIGRAAIRRLHFNFRDNRAYCGRPVRAYAAAAPSAQAGFSDGLSATVMDIKI